MKPNIIILLPTLSIAGGTQRCAIDQAIMLDSDYDVCLCTLDDKKSVLEIPQTIRVFSLKSNSNIIFSRFFNYFWRAKNLYLLSRNLNTSIIISNLWPSDFISFLTPNYSLLKVAVFHHPVNGDRENIKLLKYRFVPFIVYKFFDAFVSVSPPIMDEYISLFGIRKSKITEIPNVVHASISPGSCEGTPRSSSLTYDIAWVGRLTPHKNVVLLPWIISALQKFYNLNVTSVVIGKGSQINNLYSSCAKANVRITTSTDLTSEHNCQILHIPYLENLEDVYSISRLFISTSSFEGFGIAIAEALSAGKPVIAADAYPGSARYVMSGDSQKWTSASQIVEISTGFLLPPIEHYTDLQATLFPERRFVMY